MNHITTNNNSQPAKAPFRGLGVELYPLKFQPILKSIIWGGSDICTFKNITPAQDGIGESWEISGVEGNVSVVSDGELAGKSLDELITTYQSELVGKKVFDKFGETFPLLIKFIDARDDLSIQVHPNDELAKKRHNSFGKTEMWYVVKSSPTAFLYSGFAKNISPEQYEQMIEDNTFTDTLQKYNVSAGDVFFLPAGRVHAIGAGCFVAEIQQNSNITYRIYDYNRKDAQGNARELHTEQAKDAIDYQVYDTYKTEYSGQINHPVELVSCEYFTTNLLEMDIPMARHYEKLDSFVIYICMQGHCTLKDDKGNSLFVQQGESVLIPADTQSTLIIPSEKTKILETFIK
ncbi:type I phosphomannose isomerase catalytic subunit [Petrimonas sp.]|uniref:type I phosphomannose isomerase catalytic subunit n=1 Tax=Petrimonas sp. TaxID=2023866 RepID=UPI003F511736